jgi:hypothetical protein
MSSIVWLASYPKSGSTWFRALLANLSRTRAEPASLDTLGSTIASSREWFDRAAGLEAGELTHAEVDALRPRVYEHSAKTSGGEEPHFHKIHDAFAVPGDRAPVIAPAVSRGAIYLVRNPLDVCVSYAHHSSWSLDVSVATMGDQGHSLCGHEDRLANQLRQHVSSWSAHVRSWLDNGVVPVHVVRYEDLASDPVDTVAEAIAFAGLVRRRDEIERAVEWSRFERLQAQEEETGFREKPSRHERFFRRGVVDGWRDELTGEQARRIVADHAEMMRRVGYAVTLP